MNNKRIFFIGIGAILLVGGMGTAYFAYRIAMQLLNPPQIEAERQHFTYQVGENSTDWESVKEDTSFYNVTISDMKISPDNTLSFQFEVTKAPVVLETIEFSQYERSLITIPWQKFEENGSGRMEEISAEGFNPFEPISVFFTAEFSDGTRLERTLTFLPDP